MFKERYCRGDYRRCGRYIAFKAERELKRRRDKATGNAITRKPFLLINGFWWGAKRRMRFSEKTKARKLSRLRVESDAVFQTAESLLEQIRAEFHRLDESDKSLQVQFQYHYSVCNQRLGLLQKLSEQANKPMEELENRLKRLREEWKWWEESWWIGWTQSIVTFFSTRPVLFDRNNLTLNNLRCNSESPGN